MPCPTHKADFLFHPQLAREYPDITNHTAVFIRQTVKYKCRRRLVASIRGAGSFLTIVSRSSFTPRPLLALICRHSFFFIPSTCSISSAVISGCAAARSTLFITPIISTPVPAARYALATVWAWTPCVASTTRSAPSHAAKCPRDLVMEIHVTGRIDKVEHILLAFALVLHRDRRGLYRDAALPLDIHIVEQLRLCLRATVTAPVSSIIRSASVLLPWSICAIIEKFRICSVLIFYLFTKPAIITGCPLKTRLLSKQLPLKL